MLLASAAPASAAAWSGPTDVPDGPLGETPAIAARSGATSATAADGTTWVAWVQTASFVSGPTDRVRVARRDADGAWRPPVDVIVVPRAAGHTSTKLQWPALEIGPSGRPVVLWGQAKPGAANSDNVFDAYASTLDASGAWSTPHPLGDAAFGTGFDGSFVVHRLRSGAVAAAWRSSATGVRAAVLGAGGSWSAASELTGTALAAQRDVDIASDATGRITVIWSDAGGVTARTRNESGSWTPAQVVDSTTTSGSAPRIAADADGFLVSSWSPAAGTIRTAHRTGSQSSWTLDDLAAPGQTKQLAPDVAFDDHGRALLAWGETTFAADGTTEDGGRIRTRTLDPDRDWGAPETVAALGGFHRPSAPRVLTAANGSATVVWTDAVSGQSPRFAKLSAASRDAGDSSWGPPTELTSDTNGYLYVRTGVRADPLGNVVLALTPMMSAVQPNVTPVQIRDLQVVPSTATRWSARWLPGSLNLRTFMNYISSDPGGGALPSAGADRPESRDRYGFRLTTTDAWRDGVTGETVLEHHGTL
ncbi:MAG: hypothetical protein ITG02_16055, partial [Patulibacter sp.]|nr:hypothetical protein [Patulibacter sp.]